MRTQMDPNILHKLFFFIICHLDFNLMLYTSSVDQFVITALGWRHTSIMCLQSQIKITITPIEIMYSETEYILLYSVSLYMMYPKIT